MREAQGKAAPRENRTANPAEGEPSRERRRFDRDCIERVFECTPALTEADAYEVILVRNDRGEFAPAYIMTGWHDRDYAEGLRKILQDGEYTLNMATLKAVLG